MQNIAIINGPNLNLLGSREPHIYGHIGFDEILSKLEKRFTEVKISYYQSNVEGEIINYLHECMNTQQGIILNAGAYTHTSIAIADAITAIQIPVIEVHISNILAREEFRKTSFIAARCIGSISGLGTEVYALAMQYFVDTHKR
jgi:3-dehydroquinate dehydratase-2